MRFRLYHVTKELERVRAVLKDWHRLAQQALDAQVHSFCTQLAQLDSNACLGSDSTPPDCLFLESSVRAQQVNDLSPLNHTLSSHALRT